MQWTFRYCLFTNSTWMRRAKIQTQALLKSLGIQNDGRTFIWSVQFFCRIKGIKEESEYNFDFLLNLEISEDVMPVAYCKS